MQKSKNDVWVGLFVLLGLAAVLFLALKSANLLSFNLDPTYRITAKFDNIGGLKAQAAVKSAGVVVGRVKAIEFDDKDYQARVVLELQRAYQFPKDSSLKILTSGLLGEQYLGIEAGNDEKNLAAGDVIKATQSAIVLENLISTFMSRMASGDSKSDTKGETKGEAKDNSEADAAAAAAAAAKTANASNNKEGK